MDNAVGLAVVRAYLQLGDNFVGGGTDEMDPHGGVPSALTGVERGGEVAVFVLGGEQVVQRSRVGVVRHVSESKRRQGRRQVRPTFAKKSAYFPQTQADVHSLLVARPNIMIA